MNIRQKILLYFSVIVPIVTGIAFIFIFLMFSAKREEEFQMRQKDKITTTLKMLTQIRQIDDELIEDLDQLTINDLYDEKLLIFDNNKSLLYSSIDDTPIPFFKDILSKLNADNKWTETKDGLYDIVGTYIEKNGATYYGISKAYDNYGYSKLSYLKFILTLTFFIISGIILLVSFYLSKKITQPLLAITRQINNYDFESDYSPIVSEQTKNEIAILAQQFNKLMQKMNMVFSFQKHAIHHISHELKTPIAILVSNFERIEKVKDIDTMHTLIQNQKEDTKNLGEIINALLEIAKAETGSMADLDKTRIDELLFDVADELNNLYPDFRFLIEYIHTEHESDLTIAANARLLKAALMNLMLNCILYSSDKKAKVTIEHKDNTVRVAFENQGSIITSDENQFLFQHFFRGENSQGKRGFGLGLVFAQKILAMHKGHISYDASGSHTNIFTISLPLS